MVVFTLGFSHLQLDCCVGVMGLFVNDNGILDTYSDDRSIDDYREYRGDNV